MILDDCLLLCMMGTVSETMTTFALRDQEKIGPSAADYSPNYLSTSLIVRVGKGVKKKKTRLEEE